MSGECVKIGARWSAPANVSDVRRHALLWSSPNKHATKHARATSHPVIASAEQGERWLCCYPDDDFVEYSPARST